MKRASGRCQILGVASIATWTVVALLLSSQMQGQAGAPQPLPDCIGADLSKDLNVFCKEDDPNGAALNPDWAEHVRNGIFPLGDKNNACFENPALAQCTSQPTLVDEARVPKLGVCFFGCVDCIHGHVNWRPATFTGKIGWLNFADDWDFNFQLLREDQAGIAANNEEVITGNQSAHIMELEFDSDETVANFTTDWWSSLYRKARDLNFDAIEHQFNPSCPTAWPQGVVYGDFGLDCEHGCRSEIHPVYAVALEADPSADQNTWAIFARNWGDEGFCSHLNHTLDSDSIRILLPRNTTGTPEVLTTAGTTEFASSGSIPFPDVNYLTGKGLLLTFHLGPAKDRGVAEMLLKIKWTNDTAAVPACSSLQRPMLLSGGAASLGGASRHQAEPSAAKGSADEEFGGLFRKATGKSPQISDIPVVHDEFLLQTIPPVLKKNQKRTLPDHVEIVMGEPAGRETKTPVVIPTFSLSTTQRDRSAIAEICAAVKSGKVKVSNQQLLCPAQSNK